MGDCIVLRPDFTYGAFRVKDPISALTHFIALCLSAVGLPVLLIRASYCGADIGAMISYSVFMFSMILLYSASTAYHSFHISEKADRVLKKLDHMMIFVLIAGTYTPVCTQALGTRSGLWVLIYIWCAAALGIVFKALWVGCPKWVSSVIYISMGWTALFVISPLYRALGWAAFSWLLAGGVAYTAGGLVYVIPGRRGALFGPHELFHIFVMLGSFCHYMMMVLYLVRM